MSENAYYIPGESSGKVKLPKGEYEATIINLEMVNNIKCGDFIADIFKPVYISLAILSYYYYLICPRYRYRNINII